MAEDWHPEDVRAAIKKSGLSLAQLADKIGYSKAAVGKVLWQPWPRVEALVAAHLGKRVTDIWPSRYDADGNPLPGPAGKPRIASTAASSSTHRKSGARA